MGTYTYATTYVKSLFHDLGNPMFRNLVGVEDINGVLLAALLHDLGQYPLAHDLEEVHEGIFKHSQLGLLYLDDATRDQHGRTLRTIIEDPKHGWGVPIESLKRILGAHSRNLSLLEEGHRKSLKADVLAAIIDGPVDADKADYIVRDSSRCELPYGDQLDLERLFRVLTVAVIWDHGDRRVTLGVYDKGIASAHAFGQARYQLLATVYWHHTVRIAKAMLQHATAMALPPEVFWHNDSSGEKKVLELREQLLAFVKALVPPFMLPERSEQKDGRKMDLLATPPEDVVDTLDEPESELKTGQPEGNAWYPGIAWTDWLMLRWIAALPAATRTSRSLIYAIQSRRLYKRVATLNRGSANDSLIRKLQELSWPERLKLCTTLHERVRDRLKREWDSVGTTPLISSTQFDRLCSTNLLILIDVPRPSSKVGYDRPLGVVPELKERSYHQESHAATEDSAWRETMEKMINGIAPVRILCHPQVRNLVSASYAPAESALAGEIRSILGMN